MSISFLIFPVDFAGNLHGFPARPVSHPSVSPGVRTVAELFSRRAFAPGKSVALTVFFRIGRLVLLGKSTGNHGFYMFLPSNNVKYRGFLQIFPSSNSTLFLRGYEWTAGLSSQQNPVDPPRITNGYTMHKLQRWLLSISSDMCLWAPKFESAGLYLHMVDGRSIPN